jgi:hypothetical protein
VVAQTPVAVEGGGSWGGHCSALHASAVLTIVLVVIPILVIPIVVFGNERGHWFVLQKSPANRRPVCNILAARRLAEVWVMKPPPSCIVVFSCFHRLAVVAGAS